MVQHTDTTRMEFAVRFRELLEEMGFLRPNGNPDVRRFNHDQRFTNTSVYDWARGKALPGDFTMDKIAEDLKTTPAWLRYGIGPKHPVGVAPEVVPVKSGTPFRGRKSTTITRRKRRVG